MTFNEKGIAFFEAIRAIIRCRNSKNKKITIAANSNIGFTPYTMQIIARKHLILVKKGKYKKRWNSGEFPVFTEENLNQIYDIAKELNVPWALLMNIRIDINKCRIHKYKMRVGFFSGGRKNLLIDVLTDTQSILIELEKRKFNAWTPSSRLIEIEKTIKQFSKRMVNKSPEANSFTEPIPESFSTPECGLCKDTGICSQCFGFGELEGTNGNIIVCPICEGLGSCRCERAG